MASAAVAFSETVFGPSSPPQDIFTSSNNNTGHMPVNAFLIGSDVEGNELVLVLTPHFFPSHSAPLLFKAVRLSIGGR